MSNSAASLNAQIGGNMPGFPAHEWPLWAAPSNTEPRLEQPPLQNTEREGMPINRIERLGSVVWNTGATTTRREAPHAPSINVTMVPAATTAQSQKFNADVSPCDVIFVGEGTIMEREVQHAKYFMYNLPGVNFYAHESLDDMVKMIMDPLRAGLVPGLGLDVNKNTGAPPSPFSEERINKLVLILAENPSNPLSETAQGPAATFFRYGTPWSMYHRFKLMGCINAPAGEFQSAIGASIAPAYGGAGVDLRFAVAVSEQVTVTNYWGPLTAHTIVGFLWMRVLIRKSINGEASMNQNDWTPTPRLVPATLRGGSYNLANVQYLGQGGRPEDAIFIPLGTVMLLNSPCCSSEKARRMAAGLPDENGVQPTLEQSHIVKNGLDTILIHRAPQSAILTTVIH